MHGGRLDSQFENQERSIHIRSTTVRIYIFYDYIII